MLARLVVAGMPWARARGVACACNAIAWFRSTRRASRYEKRLFAAPPTFDRRVEHLESVLDSVAGQVDRLANGQEFLSRIMGERSTRGAERPQVETPH